MRYISFALRGDLLHRILVVDDFKAWRDEACEIMETQPDLQVIAQAGDGEEAVQLATDLKPDLVVARYWAAEAQWPSRSRTHLQGVSRNKSSLLISQQ